MIPDFFFTCDIMVVRRAKDLRYIQELLGHNSSKTTEIYTHVATTNFRNIKNPIDEIIK